MVQKRSLCYCLSFKIRAKPYWNNDESCSHITGDYAGFFPPVECDACRQDYFESFLSFPQIDIFRLPQPKLFKRLRYVKPKRYRELVGKVVDSVGKEYPFQPGCNLGPFKGSYSKIGQLIEWSGVIDVFFHDDLMELLHQRKIYLDAIRIPLSGSDGINNDYSILCPAHFDPFPPDYLIQRGITLCGECGNLLFDKIDPAPGKRAWYLFDQRKRSSAPPAFTTFLTPGLFFLSDALAKVLLEINLEGTQIVEIGEWI